MSSRTLRQWVLRTTKDGSRAAALTSPRRTSLSLGSTLAPGPSLMSQSGTSPLQARFFHPTATRRLFGSSEAIVAGCLGVAGGILLTRFLLKRALVVALRALVALRAGADPKYVPPNSWMQAADEKTRKDVKTIITAAFHIANRTQIRRRDQAQREASFQVPHEIARLIPDAPRFRMEDMGSLSSLRKTWQERVHGKSPFSIERDARVFLYFPNDSAKATAAFLAINAELVPPAKQRGRGRRETTHDQRLLLLAAWNLWHCQNLDWKSRHPDVLRRIGPTQLPVIVSFRGVACGSLWDLNTMRGLNLRSVQPLVSFIEDA